jgi:hypothetical protein
MPWRYNLRLQAGWSSYWITQDDLKAAATHATAALQEGEATRSRKYIAWAHKLLGDIAAREERVDDGERHDATALGVRSTPVRVWVEEDLTGWLRFVRRTARAVSENITSAASSRRQT